MTAHAMRSLSLSLSLVSCSLLVTRSERYAVFDHDIAHGDAATTIRQHLAQLHTNVQGENKQIRSVNQIGSVDCDLGDSFLT